MMVRWYSLRRPVVNQPAHSLPCPSQTVVVASYQLGGPRLRYLALLRRPGTWLLLLVIAATGVAAYYWITPRPAWRVRFDGQAMLVGHTADEKCLLVSERVGKGASTVYLRTTTGERLPIPTPAFQNTDDMTLSSLGHAISGGAEAGH